MTEIKLDLNANPYTVYVGPLNELSINTSVLIVTSKVIASFYLTNLVNLIKDSFREKSFDIATCVLEDGEETKNMQSVESILDAAFKAKLHRNSLMIALGGGVITDMVGFASGIYQRGIDFISIPTTLLAMCDASVGGKCGINNAYGKNLVGLFHQPRAVYVDLVFLQTLPKREFNAGIAEMLKMFAGFDFSALENFSVNELDSFIAYAIELKARIVLEDETEKLNKRALLNYGHTFAHAIELETNYKSLLHGEAVAVGMIMANRLSLKLGILEARKADFIESMINIFSLPTTYKIKDVNAFYESFFLDKKSIDSKLHFVLLDDAGLKVHNDVPKDLVLEVLNEFV
ncbi:3-dehydroquinate synthase [Helicobacter sp. 11S02629-2]|uniref:3-dehydroquinate synthase n=1 Tax=Helicobacter sp. 11S02629-2 TaxID=1476195 RepID=UPI000BA5C3A3|nr:3-dehydroquinate synthase [Helicobacter sp. 11S02629-2]PAF44371.1 3-dehydroquinate synthase [Helicobacter sp. 11S02629-2]